MNNFRPAFAAAFLGGLASILVAKWIEGSNFLSIDTTSWIFIAPRWIAMNLRNNLWSALGVTFLGVLSSIIVARWIQAKPGIFLSAVFPVAVIAAVPGPVDDIAFWVARVLFAATAFIGAVFYSPSLLRFTNDAGPKDLERLPGVGSVKAQAIFNYRKIHGPFSVITDLLKVPGVGSVTLTKIRNFWK